MEQTGDDRKGPFAISADPLVRKLIPGYLQNRRNDLQNLAGALARRDFAVTRKLGHDMAGSGGAYGLPPISELGRRIESASLSGDTAVIEGAITDLQAFLDSVELPAA